jgi:hypothetical protein
VVGVPLIVIVLIVAAEVSITNILRLFTEPVVVYPATKVLKKKDIKKAAILKDKSAILNKLLNKKERS